ncbi:MAG: bifunctional nuclease domain-containing protein [Bdellovibrionota bacterium]
MSSNLQKDLVDLQKLLKGQIFFSDSGDEEVFHQDDLIQLHPMGVSFAADSEKPFLLLRDNTNQHTLPVAVNPMEAGICMQQGSGAFTVASPFRLVQELLNSLDIKFLQCVFVQIKGPVQYVRIYMTGHPKQNSLKLRADEAVAACLHFGIPVFATKSFIARSKVLTAQMDGVRGRMMKDQKLLNKNHPHLM